MVQSAVAHAIVTPAVAALSVIDALAAAADSSACAVASVSEPQHTQSVGVDDTSPPGFSSTSNNAEFTTHTPD